MLTRDDAAISFFFGVTGQLGIQEMYQPSRKLQKQEEIKKIHACRDDFLLLAVMP